MSESIINGLKHMSLPNPEPWADKWKDDFQHTDAYWLGEAAKRLEQLEDAVTAIIDAVSNPGPHPRYHCEILTRHRAEWPMLWKALDRLME